MQSLILSTQVRRERNGKKNRFFRLIVRLRRTIKRKRPSFHTAAACPEPVEWGGKALDAPIINVDCVSSVIYAIISFIQIP
jgi:hypothetical protein